MANTCFVIMGYQIKTIPNTKIKVNLDDTYEYLIKPTLIKENLVSIYNHEHLKHSFRSDEVYTTQAINETFIKNIYEADIVIADITALNQNAIYELGMRHAMKPKSTIIICDEKTLKTNSFFDLTFVPHLTYNSTKQKDINEIKRFSDCLSKIIHTCKNSDDEYIDSPVFHMGVYNKKETAKNPHRLTESLRTKIKMGNDYIENENYENAVLTFEDIMDNYKYSDNNIVCSYVLASYKSNNSVSNLTSLKVFLSQKIDLENTTCEDALGISAAISLKLFNITGKAEHLYSAIEHYRIGADYESGNIYCGRNYCTSLLKIYLLEAKIEIVKEYYYTAVHYAKIYLSNAHKLKRESDDFNNAWFLSNQADLLLISSNVENTPFQINYMSKRQEKTIIEGRQTLENDLKKVKSILGI